MTLTSKQIAAEVRTILRGAHGCRVPVSYLHGQLYRSHGITMGDLIGALDLVKGIVRVRGTGAAVMLG